MLAAPGVSQLGTSVSKVSWQLANGVGEFVEAETQFAHAQTVDNWIGETLKVGEEIHEVDEKAAGADGELAVKADKVDDVVGYVEQHE